MSVEVALTDLAREESGRVLALLAGRLGDLDLADEAVQEALITAWATWPERGVPDDPAAWLHTVARNKAVDRLRRRAAAARRERAAAADLVEAFEPATERHLLQEDPVDGTPVGDDQLRLMLLCCHPALHRDAQVALTLRLVGGLTTTEIAAAYLQPEATITQRIVRAKRKIRDAGIPLHLPARLDERIDGLLTVLYLVFNEGYLARGAQPLRVDLADEAVRLTRRTRGLLPDHAETGGLLALMLLQRARFAGRFDGAGDLVLLEHQDRTRWDAAGIAEGHRVLAAALRLGRPGAYQLQGVVAALHAGARTYADTDWTAVVAAYDALVGLTDSPVARLNRAAAVGRADGPRAGLRALDDVTGLDGYHLLHATRGELLLRAGERDEGLASLERALELAPSEAERRHLVRRIGAERRP
ncbi:RNA polymerase sigma factor [Nocardioides sp.]|uniref:RNA polymerase sigma factor n=1 Tax=Nocardioides sp. TaxID=35761 RepID=UPI002720B619|nr:sigma-70 family RNA polymerase sigma factor [Nocardioides sp.]MDO9457830.1 sigma-70 family RNA polymerase sigma factor [Nocardioides sp.]